MFTGSRVPIVDYLLDPLFIALVLYIAAFIKVYKKQYEHGLTRFIGGLWFTYVWFNPHVDTITLRVMGRWLFALPFFTEILSIIFRTIPHNRQSKYDK